MNRRSGAKQVTSPTPEQVDPSLIPARAINAPSAPSIRKHTIID